MSLVLFGLSHVTGEESDRMHKGLFESEVLLRDFYVLDKHVQVACQVVADFDLPLLSNAADCFDQILVGSLHVPLGASVDLKSNVLNWILVPDQKLIL